MTKNIAVKTGISSGIGRDFVYVIDREYGLDKIRGIAGRDERLGKRNDTKQSM